MIYFIKSAVIALFFALLLAANTAKAQFAPCPGGRQVDQRCSNGVCEPVCVYDNQTSEPAPTQGPAPSYSRSPRYAAVVMHTDANDVWAVSDILSKREGHDILLNRCTSIMGSGCKVTMTVQNATIAIGRDQRGLLWNDWGETPKKAEKKMMATCAAQGGRCKLMRNFKATPGFAFEGVPEIDLRTFYFPDPATVRNIYGATAWIDGKNDTAQASMVWISTGKATMATAENDAVAQCQKATQAKCSNAVRSINGFIGIAYDSDGGTKLSTDLSKKEAEAAVLKNCKKDKKKCSNIQTVDARQPGRIVIDARPATNAKK
jgi:hypothetical protein